MKKINELKLKCKELASEIKAAKTELKQAQKNKLTVNAVSKLMYDLLNAKRTFRGYHIAYCELRGKTREQIEPKIRKFNEPDEFLIRKVKKEYAWEVEDEVETKESVK